MNKILERDDILYPELSYKIVGILFEAGNTLGNGFHERYYQKLIAALLKKSEIKFKEQVSIHLMINNEKIATGIVDFMIEDKIILEIKRGDRFFKQNIDQIYSYLKISKKELGILANFTSRGVQFKRILNTY